LTYQHQGPRKAGINHEDHAYIYMVDQPPKRLKGGLANESVQIKGKSPRDKLDADSCINYAKIYNIEHNVKVFFIGQLTPSSEKKVLLAVNEAWNRNTSSTPNTTT
jgi:hypothetical protein